MRGYVATVVGGLLGGWIGIAVVFRPLMDWFDGYMDEVWSETTEHTRFRIIALAVYVVVYFGSGLLAAGTAGIVARVVGAGAAWETSLAAIPVVELYMLWAALPFLTFYLPGLYDLGNRATDWNMQHLPALAAAPVLALIAARWLGVTWHRRRTARASGDV